MTRQRSRAHSTNSLGSALEDGDGITRHGIPEDKAPFPNFSNSRFCPPVGATYFRQKTTKPAKFCKRASAQEPSLRLTGHVFVMVHINRKCPCRSDIRKRNHCN